MSRLLNRLLNVDVDQSEDKYEILDEIRKFFEEDNYNIVEIWGQKPWGAYLRFNNKNADRFMQEFFPNLKLEDVTLGNVNAELSPKILIVAPGKRLSWQWHSRRAEIWTFLNDGHYAKSPTDDEVDLETAKAGEVVKIRAFERHRLAGNKHQYTIVAEIWSHTDVDNPSNEDDIVRLQDDYNR